eukprot:761539-Hanusia_phi.AAC.2
MPGKTVKKQYVDKKSGRDAKLHTFGYPDLTPCLGQPIPILVVNASRERIKPQTSKFTHRPILT